MSFIANWWTRKEEPASATEREVAEGVLSLRRFDLHQMRKFSVCAIIGPRRSGKTEICKALLRQIPTDEKIVVAPCETVRPEYGPTGLISKENIHTTLSKADFDLVKYVALRKSRRAEVAPQRSMLVLDEIQIPGPLYVSTEDEDQHEVAERKEAVVELFLNGRFLQTQLVVAQASVHGLPPKMRENIEYLLLFPPSSEVDDAMLGKLYEHYGSSIPTRDRFYQLMDMCRKDAAHTCLVIDRTNRDDNLYLYNAGE